MMRCKRIVTLMEEIRNAKENFIVISREEDIRETAA
jgi:hypothetical protein